MSRVKTIYKLPKDVTLYSIAILRGYNRRKTEYLAEYNIITMGRAYNELSEFEKEAINNLNDKTDSKIYLITKNALMSIAQDIDNKQLRTEFIEALYYNCIDKNYSFKNAYLDISKKYFFQEKHKLLYLIAHSMNLV